MKDYSPNTVLALAVAVACVGFAPSVCAQNSKETVPLKLDFPAHTLKGTPEDLPSGPHIEPVSDDPPPPIQVPKGVENVAVGKPVTGSVRPFFGELTQVTDGEKEPLDEDTAEFKKGVQWVQVDLGKPYEIHAVAMWHDHRYVQAMRDVILQVSNDPEFKANDPDFESDEPKSEYEITTLYNNDVDNSAGLGVGTDREYFEMEYGRIVPAKGVKARYVRGYTRGSSQSALNCWQEIEVYALPAE